MPSEPTVEEVRKLLKHVERVHPGHSTDVIVVGRNIVAKICNHFLASKQPMTAGEFAAELIAVCECQCLDWEALVNNAPVHEAVLRATRNARLSEWSAMKITIESLARDRNITIVEPKK